MYVFREELSECLYLPLQENNAFAVVDVENADVLELYPMGFKDWAACGGLDASDRDGGKDFDHTYSL